MRVLMYFHHTGTQSVSVPYLTKLTHNRVKFENRVVPPSSTAAEEGEREREVFGRASSLDPESNLINSLIFRTCWCA